MNTVPHPGEFIREICLAPLNISVKDAAEKIGIKRRYFSALLNGNARINTRTAIKLGNFFNVTPESFLTQQIQYDLWKIRGE